MYSQSNRHSLLYTIKYAGDVHSTLSSPHRVRSAGNLPRGKVIGLDVLHDRIIAVGAELEQSPCAAQRHQGQAAAEDQQIKSLCLCHFTGTEVLECV